MFMSKFATAQVHPLTCKELLYGAIAALAIGFVAYFTLFGVG
jgi:hypothetical protein